MKITSRFLESEAAGETASFSFELFVPESPESIELVKPKLDRFAALEPLFIDVSGYGGQNTVRDAARLALHAKKYGGIAAMVHIQHALLPKQTIIELLDDANAAGIRNVFVEYGEERAHGSDVPPVNTPAGGEFFSSTTELVRLIAQRYNGSFCVCVAGYPGPSGEGGESHEAGLRTLLAHQEAGASFILAQHVFEASAFLNFVVEARETGITLPIVPSILLLHNSAATTQINEAVGVTLPLRVAALLKAAGDDEETYRRAGVAIIAQLCADLLSAGVTTLHFITLNLETSAKQVLSELGLSGPGAAARRKLPWRPSADEARAGEDVRPIFWANRPASYVERTSAWKSFPCGRWGAGNARGEGLAFRPFDDLPESALVPASAGTPEERRAIWGEAPRAQSDIWSVFAAYVEGRVPRLPWCDVALLPETGLIQQQLARINRSGFLTINSQPRVNAARSDDPTFGWGGPGGFVYQKAYVECFCPPGHLGALMEACVSSKRPTVTYHAVNTAGLCFTNSRAGQKPSGAAASSARSPVGEGCKPLATAAGFSGPGAASSAWSSVNAVTWGVFPDKEILQPTVMDPEAFRGAWRAEAFTLWTRQWAVIYDDDSPSADLLHDIHDSYFLVNLVDNDFMNGDLFAVFEDAMRTLAEPVVPGQQSKANRDPGAVFATLAAAEKASTTPPFGARSGSYTGLSSLAMHPRA